MKICIRLTPLGHYFLGGERGFQYDDELERQMSASYFVKSLKVPSQTTLFGALRYLIGVKNEKLRGNSSVIIGQSSYNIVDDNDDFGIIKGISPLYLYKKDKENKAGGNYYIRTPFDHKLTQGNDYYTPMKVAAADTCVINYPGNQKDKRYPVDFKAKDGISKSYMSLPDGKLVSEDEIFVSSVEVVSRKSKGGKNEDGFAKKEYFRLNDNWLFTFFAELDTDKLPEYNKTVILGKDASVFGVEITEDLEPDVESFFKNRGADFHYCQSPVYVDGAVSTIIDNCSFSILESETLRCFTSTVASNGDVVLHPHYGNKQLLKLISAGSIIYSDNAASLYNAHASIAGFNRIING